VVGGWIGPRTGLDEEKLRKIPYSYRELNPDSSTVQPVAGFYTDELSRLNCSNMIHKIKINTKYIK
jgi:hypothetical protein